MNGVRPRDLATRFVVIHYMVRGASLASLRFVLVFRGTPRRRLSAAVDCQQTPGNDSLRRRTCSTCTPLVGPSRNRASPPTVTRSLRQHASGCRVPE